MFNYYPGLQNETNNSIYNQYFIILKAWLLIVKMFLGSMPPDPSVVGRAICVPYGWCRAHWSPPVLLMSTATSFQKEYPGKTDRSCYWKLDLLNIYFKQQIASEETLNDTSHSYLALMFSTLCHCAYFVCVSYSILSSFQTKRV